MIRFIAARLRHGYVTVPSFENIFEIAFPAEAVRVTCKRLSGMPVRLCHCVQPR